MATHVGSRSVAAVTIDLSTQTLEDHLIKDLSFPSAYWKLIGSIASADGFVSLAEYSVINDIAKNSDESAVASATLLHSLERPTAVKDALVNLKTASSSVNVSVRQAAFLAARPLLELQGYGARDLAKRIATALSYDLHPTELAAFPAEEEKTLLKKMFRGSLRMVKGKDLRNLASMCLSVTGDVQVAQKVSDYEDGTIDANELRVHLNAACAEVNRQIQSFQDQLQVAEFASEATTAYLKTAKELKKQVVQRMAVVEARLNFERETFAEDMDYIIDDAGNAFEVEVTDRLKTDKWKETRVWESISRGTFAKTLEYRIQKQVSRREQMLGLIKEDLRLFQEEMRITRTSILRQQHHTRFASLMPTLRMKTKVVNAVDSAASVTLGTGGIAIAGAGAAAYFLGAAVVLPVIAPAAPFVAIPLILAGAFKWFSDPEARKDGEIKHKRKVFEDALRTQLCQAQESFNKQLESVASDFQQSAVLMIQPIMLEAEAADSLAGLQVKMARRLIDHSIQSLAKVSQATP